jgi:iron complex outermembrane recepter protein
MPSTKPRYQKKNWLPIGLFVLASVHWAGAGAQEEGVVEEPAAESSSGPVRLDSVEVTGSRIQREDYSANSPVTTVTRDQIDRNADITVETFLNTLPQAVPAGTKVSNNPGNGGQANIDLRGLGSNRNLVLIDGRRPMVSASDQTVDLNTIPQALIERIEVLTGGAGAVYGADAIAGAVNIILRKDFEGIDFRGTYSDSTPENDSREQQFSLTWGTGLGGRGNLVAAFDYADREALIKSQRPFAAIATSTTTFLPEGLYAPGSNAPTQAAIDSVFASYGVPAGAVTNSLTLIGFNLDGTLFSRGIFNSPLDVQNFRYPVDLKVNTNIFPDLYSYNFDEVNLLVLPLERYSSMARLNYDLFDNVEVFGQVQYTEYEAVTALAPTPIPTVRTARTGENTANQAQSALVESGTTIANQLIVPVTNPFIPADFLAILNSRTGDNTALVGSGATEPFLMRQRTLDAGLRESIYDNTVYQYLLGARGPVGFSGWRWNLYASEGRTKIVQTQLGNINTDRVQQLLEAPDGGASQCAGGFNPFGRQGLSPECVAFLEVATSLETVFDQRIVQGYVTGDVFELPAGSVSTVFGVERREFEYELDPGSAAGAISGFNQQNPAGGENTFSDFFVETLFPLVRGEEWAQALDLGFAYRLSRSEFEDTVAGIASRASNDSAYKFDLSWQPSDLARVRASYQRAVRAPNFGELFDGGGSAPQYFDPCSVTTNARNGPDAAALRLLCQNTGLGASVDSFVQTPGNQLQIITSGNTELKPETGTTHTLGIVLTSPWDHPALNKLTASVDFYNISIDGAILTPDPNLLVAACYNYFGSNPTYDSTDANCQTILRIGGDIVFLDSGSPDGSFPGQNGAKIKTSGLDFQIDYGLNLADFGLPSNSGRLAFNFLANYLLKFEAQERGDLPSIDYAGTVSYFGEGLSAGGGSSFPELRMNLSSRYLVGPFSFDVRTRYIDAMDNRASRQFSGETVFTGVGSVTYWDLGTGWQASSNLSMRFGFNNILDKQPPQYAPNIQSGTDPSLYDVVGRRALAQVKYTFF